MSFEEICRCEKENERIKDEKAAKKQAVITAFLQLVGFAAMAFIISILVKTCDSDTKQSGKGYFDNKLYKERIKYQQDEKAVMMINYLKAQSKMNKKLYALNDKTK